MQLQSYQNNKELKTSFLKEIVKHRKADQILQGTYGKQNGIWKGCAVGCSLRSLAILRGEKLKTEYNNHADYEKYLGVPEWLARLEDTIFEGLPKEDAMKWPEQFAKAIPVGVNLEPVKWKFCAFILKENIERILTLDISDELKKQVVDAIRQTLAVHTNATKTGEWDEKAARSAWSAAWSVARSAWSVARSARSAESAAWSAESAAESAARSAWSVARSATRSAWSVARSAESAAWSAAYKKYAKHLLKLLKEAK